MKITYSIEEIADIVRARAEKDLYPSQAKMKAGDVSTEYVTVSKDVTELASMTVEMESK